MENKTFQRGLRAKFAIDDFVADKVISNDEIYMTSKKKNIDKKTTIKDLGESFYNMDSNDMIVDGFIIDIDGKEIFSKELSLKLHAPGDDGHVEYRCEFYVQ